MERYSEIAKRIRKVRKTQGRKDLEDKFKIKAEKENTSYSMRGSNMILDDTMMVSGKSMVPYNDINPVSSDDDTENEEAQNSSKINQNKVQITNNNDSERNRHHETDKEDETTDDNESSDESDEDDDDDNEEDSRDKYDDKQHDDFDENGDTNLSDVDESENKGQSRYYGEEGGDDDSASTGDGTHCTNTDSIDCNNEYGKSNVL